MTGPTGCGKTGLATGFLINAINHGHTGRYVRFADLVGELYRSVADHSETRVLKRYAAYECLLIDEIGYIEVEPVQVGLFFTLMQQRHKRRCTLITSNLGFSEWRTFLKNDHLTAALVDRLTETSHIFNLKECVTLRPKLNSQDGMKGRLDGAELERLRMIPLPEVLRRCGATSDRADPQKWHTAVGTLSIAGPKFINWQRGHGGGGAIDLAMHLLGRPFIDAVAWLRINLPADVPVAAEPVVRSQPAPLRLPVADSGHLRGVLRYLTGHRGLAEGLVRELVDQGDLYADAHANAVFVLRDQNGNPVGAELRGTAGPSWRGMAPGSKKDLGCFTIGPACESVAICESAIDAISLYQLMPDHRTVSAAGARPTPAWLPSLLAAGRVDCAFDADPVGDRMACTMIAAFPAVRRLRPPRHDWNDVLTASL